MKPLVATGTEHACRRGPHRVHRRRIPCFRSARNGAHHTSGNRISATDDRSHDTNTYPPSDCDLRAGRDDCPRDSCNCRTGRGCPCGGAAGVGLHGTRITHNAQRIQLGQVRQRRAHAQVAAGDDPVSSRGIWRTTPDHGRESAGQGQHCPVGTSRYRIDLARLRQRAAAGDRPRASRSWRQVVLGGRVHHRLGLDVPPRGGRWRLYLCASARRFSSSRDLPRATRRPSLPKRTRTPQVEHTIARERRPQRPPENTRGDSCSFRPRACRHSSRGPSVPRDRVTWLSLGCQTRSRIEGLASAAEQHETEILRETSSRPVKQITLPQ